VSNYHLGGPVCSVDQAPSEATHFEAIRFWVIRFWVIRCVVALNVAPLIVAIPNAEIPSEAIRISAIPGAMGATQSAVIPVLARVWAPTAVTRCVVTRFAASHCAAHCVVLTAVSQNAWGVLRVDAPMVLLTGARLRAAAASRLVPSAVRGVVELAATVFLVAVQALPQVVRYEAPLDSLRRERSAVLFHSRPDSDRVCLRPPACLADLCDRHVPRAAALLFRAFQDAAD
jgi:hypothetical protein